MKYTDLLVSVPLWLIAGTAFAQPLCGGAGVPASSLICKPTSSNLQGTDVLLGAQATGPGTTGSNVEVRVPISQIQGAGGVVTYSTITTTNKCAVTGMAAAINCGAAPAGSVAVSAGTSSVTLVSSTVVTANSQIMLTVDESLGTLLGVTCNTSTTSGALVAVISARSAGASFSIETPGVSATNPVCVNYEIIN